MTNKIYKKTDRVFADSRGNQVKISIIHGGMHTQSEQGDADFPTTWVAVSIRPQESEAVAAFVARAGIKKDYDAAVAKGDVAQVDQEIRTNGIEIGGSNSAVPLGGNFSGSDITGVLKKYPFIGRDIIPAISEYLTKEAGADACAEAASAFQRTGGKSDKEAART